MLMGIAFPLYKESPRIVSALLEGFVSKHVINFIYWDPVFVYFDRWGWSDSVLRTSVGLNCEKTQLRPGYHACQSKGLCVVTFPPI